MGKKEHDTLSRLTATTTVAAVLVSAILLGSTLAIGYLMNVQTAQAAPGGEGGDNGKGGSGADQQQLNAILSIARGDNDKHHKENGESGNNDNSNNNGGGNGNSNNNDDDNGGSRSSSGGDSGGGQDQYCYSATVTNPLNGKTRTVDVCFDSRSDCDQAEQHDPDSGSGCDTQ